MLSRSAGPPVSAARKGVHDYPNGMAAHDAVRFRLQALEAQQNAANATTPFDIKAWLLIAADWLELAQAVEARQANRLASLN